jgi:hypothetical protein
VRPDRVHCGHPDMAADSEGLGDADVRSPIGSWIARRVSVGQLSTRHSQWTRREANVASQAAVSRIHCAVQRTRSAMIESGSPLSSAEATCSIPNVANQVRARR